MNIREACERVMGRELASDIIKDMGVSWCALAAMADCKVSHGPEVKAAISAYFAELKRQNASFGDQKIPAP